MYVQPPDDATGGHTHVDIYHEHPQQGLIQVGGSLGSPLQKFGSIDNDLL